MKRLKTFMTGVITLGITNFARAQGATNYIIGSTAFRGAVYAAIHSSFFNPGFTEVTYGNSDPAKCDQMMWISGTWVIKANWSGSVAGIRVLDQGISTGGFIADSKPAGNYPTITIAANGTDARDYDQ